MSAPQNILPVIRRPGKRRSRDNKQRSVTVVSAGHRAVSWTARRFSYNERMTTRTLGGVLLSLLLVWGCASRGERRVAVQTPKVCGVYTSIPAFAGQEALDA